MKKTRLLIALLMMLVAASGYAQDSYCQSVKDYLKATDQLEKTKSTILTMSMLYESDGQVDVNQLTNHYLDEQYKNDMIDKCVDEMKLSNMTEADLRAVASLLSTPDDHDFGVKLFSNESHRRITDMAGMNFFASSSDNLSRKVPACTDFLCKFAG